MYDKGYASYQKQEWIDFAQERYGALKDAGTQPAKDRPPRAAAWEAGCPLPGVRRQRPRAMRWPIGAADDKFLDIKNAAGWDGGCRRRGRATCAPAFHHDVDGVKIIHGCCNAEVKSGALFGDRVASTPTTRASSVQRVRVQPLTTRQLPRGHRRT